MAPAALTGVIGLNGLPVSKNSSMEPRLYSEITEVRPKNNQAIVLDLLKNKDVPNEKYIDALLDVFSFRRLVYIHPEDVNKLPSSKKFKGDGATWNNSFDTGNPKCFVCGSEDHFAKQYTEVDPTQGKKSEEVHVPTDQAEIEGTENLPPSPPSAPLNTEDPFKTSALQNSGKRALSSKSGESSNTINDDGFTLIGSGKNGKTAKKCNDKSAAKKPRKESTTTHK